MKRHRQVFKKLLELSLTFVLIFATCITHTYGTSDSTTHTTTNTFISDGGEYSLAYILSHYNVFTFDYYKGTHVVGPMIVGGEAGRTTLQGDGSGSLALGGLSTSSSQPFPHLVPSYIKGKASIGNTVTTRSNVPFYLGTVNQNNSYTLAGANGNYYDYYFSDNYVDFDQAKSLIKADAAIYQNYEGPSQNGETIKKVEINIGDAFQYFKNNPDQDKYDYQDYVVYKDVVNSEIKLAVKLKLGNNYHFTSFNNVSTIIYDYEANSDPSDKTTIISCNDDKIDSFPIILKSQSDAMGKSEGLTLANEKFYQFDSIESGQNLSVTYICPNATNIEIGNEKNHPGIGKLNGHLVAVNADVKILNGDYNGTLIVKSVDSKAEGHMWSYKGIITPGSLDLTLNKKVNGQVPDQTFEFSLQQVSGPDDSSITQQFRNSLVTSQTLKDGSFKFKLSGFDRAGTYIYQIKEMNNDGYLCTPEALFAKVEVTQSGTLMLPRLVGYYLDENCTQSAEAIFNNLSKTKLTLQKVWKDKDNQDMEAPRDSINVNVYRQAYKQNGHQVQIRILQNINGTSKEIKKETVFVDGDLTFIADASVLATGQSYYVGGIKKVTTTNGSLDISESKNPVFGTFDQYGIEKINLSKITSDATIDIEVSSPDEYSPDNVKLTDFSYTSGSIQKIGEPEQYSTVTLQKGQSWKSSLDVPKYSQDGNVYHYFVEEEQLADYDVTYSNGETSSSKASDVEAKENETLTMTNKQKETVENHYLTITKVDQNDHSKKLKNAKFSLYNGNEELKVKKENDIYFYDPAGDDILTSDDQGMIKIDLDSFKSLNIKDYVLREKEAPENYLKTFDEIKLHFDCENDCYYKIDDHEQVKLNDHQEHCLEISNVQRDAVIKVPNTGYKEYPYLMLGMGLVMISLLGLMIYRKQGGKGNV